MGKVPASSGFLSSLYAAARPLEEPAESGCLLHFLFQLSLHFYGTAKVTCAKWVVHWLHQLYAEKIFSGQSTQKEYKLCPQIYFSVTFDRCICPSYISAWAPPLHCISPSSKDKSTQRNPHGSMFQCGSEWRSMWIACVLLLSCFQFIFSSFGHFWSSEKVRSDTDFISY